MRFDSVASLWFAGLALAIILLYILKARRQHITVSSIMLWDEVLHDVQAATPWQKLRHNLPMYLQILSVLLLSLALAAPVLESGALIGRSTVIILDGSGSMRATDVAPNRFGAAVSHATDIVNAMRPGDALAVVLMMEEPVPLLPLGRDKSAAIAALQQASPGYGTANLQRAASLAASLVTGSASPHIVLLSDGVVDHQLLDIPQGVGFSHVRVGLAEVPNFGVMSVGARQTELGMSVLVRVANFGPQEEDATVEVFSGSGVLASRDIRVSSGETKSVVFEGLPKREYFGARVKSDADVLWIDDVGYAILESSAQEDVLLVGSKNVFLETALSLVEDTSVFWVHPDDYLPVGGFALYVFDGFVPPALPNAPVLLVNPPSAVGHVSPVSVQSVSRLSALRPEHPVLRFLDVGEITVASFSSLAPSASMVPLVAAGSDTVIAAWEDVHSRGIVVGFDLRKSDFALKMSFPVFIMNCVEWLLPPPVAPGEHVAGKPVNVSLPAWAEQVRLIDETQKVTTVAPDAGNAVVVPPSPGIYALTMSSSAKTETRYFQAIAARTESSLRATSAVDVAGEEDVGVMVGRPIWHWLAAVALVVLSVEWWVYTRGI